DTLHILPGIYVAPATINNSKAVTIEGAGNGSNPSVNTILIPSGTAFALTTGGVSAIQRLVIRDMLVAAAGEGVRIAAGMSFVRIDNVTFLCDSHGIDFDQPDPQAVSNVVINNCTFTCGGAGVRTSPSADVSSVTISACTFDHDDGPGLLLGG